MTQKTLKGHVTFKVQPHATSGLFAQQHMNNNHKQVFHWLMLSHGNKYSTSGTCTLIGCCCHTSMYTFRNL